MFDVESNGNEVNFISSIFLITIFEGRKEDDTHHHRIGKLKP